MALIGKIRQNSWLLVVLVALGLGGFIFMDMFSGQQSLFGPDLSTMGKVEGKKISINEFTRAEQLLYGSSAGEVFTRRDYLWNYFVEETIIDKEAGLIGLGVSRDELMDLQFGTNISPIIQQRFMNPQTQQLDRTRLNDFKQAIEGGQLTDPQIRSYWAMQEKEVINQRLKEKISNLVTKAFYTPTWMAEQYFKEQNSRVDFAYVHVPFDEIDNADVALSDADYKAYLDENPSLYDNEEETRRIEYVTFSVAPTAADTAEIHQQLTELASGFAEATNDTLFVETNYGSLSPGFVTKESLSEAISDTVFQLSPGTVYGPYEEGGAIKLVKVLERFNMADSADTRHILISAAAPQEFLQAEKTADSLINLLNNGASFDTLVMRFSKDGGSVSTGGKYENVVPNQFVPEYDNVLFVTGEINKLYKVRTTYGVHIVQVLSRSASTTQRVRLAYVEQPILPSQKTQDDRYREALNFVEVNRTLEALRKAAAEKNLEVESSAPVQRNDFMLGTLEPGQASRDVIRWAFDKDTDVNDVSPEIYIYQDQINLYNNKYVVAALSSIIKAGKPRLEDIKKDIEPQVINRKKAEMIKERMRGKDMNAIAREFSVELDTASQVSFGAAFLPGLGSEPKVIAKAFSMESNAVSEPIGGNSGVYVIKLLVAPSDVESSLTMAQQRRMASATPRAQVSSRIIPAIVKNADVKDYRYRFY